MRPDELYQFMRFKVISYYEDQIKRDEEIRYAILDNHLLDNGDLEKQAFAKTILDIEHNSRQAHNLNQIELYKNASREMKAALQQDFLKYIHLLDKIPEQEYGGLYVGDDEE